MGFPGGSGGRESARRAGDGVRPLGWEDALEKGVATHSSISTPSPEQSHTYSRRSVMT